MVPSKGQGCLYTIVIGVLGALIGGALATAAAAVGDGIDGFNLGTFVIAFLGACLLLLVLYALGGDRGAAVEHLTGDPGVFGAPAGTTL